MLKQFDEIINYKIQNLGYKNPLYIAKNSSELWKHFWNIFENEFANDFSFQKPTKNEFNHRIIYLETKNKKTSLKTLFILALPEGHMQETKGHLLTRLIFKNSIFKKYIKENNSIFFITFYAPLQKDNTIDYKNSIMIISGLKEIWNSSVKYGERFFTIWNNLVDKSTGFRSIEINYSKILDLLLNKEKPILQEKIIFNDEGRWININKPKQIKMKKTKAYNLLLTKDYSSVKNILIDSNQNFIEWVKTYQTEDFELQEIQEIENDKILSVTEKETLIKARIGQSSFRNYLLDGYHECPITKIDDPNLLVASHIWPWKFANNEERLDPNNGILLSMLFDKLFDQGLISFTDDGKIIFSKQISEKTTRYLYQYKNEQYNLKLNEKRKSYLRLHRNKIFKK